MAGRGRDQQHHERRASSEQDLTSLLPEQRRRLNDHENGDTEGQQQLLHPTGSTEDSWNALHPAPHLRDAAAALDPLCDALAQASGLPADRDEQQRHPLSPWHSSSATPMTTRPHFPSHRRPLKDTGTLKRVRSRSLGSSIDREAVAAARGYGSGGWRLRQENYDPSRLVVPSLLPPPREGIPRLTSEPGPVLKDESFVRQPQHLSQSVPDNKQFTDINNHHEEDVAAPSQSPLQPWPFQDDDLSFKPDLPQQSALPSNPWWISLLYGLINATIVLPVLMSFASIIYRDPFFAPYMPALTKLTVVSGTIHQLCFSTGSSLPFAVGQVQDAGLIFLSSMASTLVRDLTQPHAAAESNADSDFDSSPPSPQPQPHDDAAILATVTVALSLATALLGAALVMLGKFRLAHYVQYLPTCVVGGYLAYIGWFCGASGVALMAGTTTTTTSTNTIGGGVDVTWHHQALRVVPGLLGGCLIYGAVRTFRHMAVLPSGIAFLLLAFYAALWGTGSTVWDATQHGWIREMEAPPVWYRTWDSLQLDRVVWSALPQLWATELSMIFVVALSSSLDVAAIELEMRRPLDYNRELSTVGWSNVVSGLTGGYTGSYIFSQSIFSLRAGIRSRAAGYCLATTQLVTLLLPFPILSYVPNFFFGSLLTLICVDLLVEWLWEVRHRLTASEYGICWCTFALIQWWGVEYGIAAGAALYATSRQLGCSVGEPKPTPAESTTTLERNDGVSSDLAQGNADDDGEPLIGNGKASVSVIGANISKLGDVVPKTQATYGAVEARSF